MIFSVTLKEHLQHLQSIFRDLTDKSICLSLNNFFLKYSSVHFLNQQVNALNLTTVKAKLTTIINFKFSQTLIQLKKYLKLTDYLQQYISHYVVIVKSLQLQKTLLNQQM